MIRSAVLSADGQYRYSLTRWWGTDNDGPTMNFIMLNPSTADAMIDDPTIRRCISFAKRDGFDGMTVHNLFAHRATNPKDMMEAVDPVGPDNFRVLDKLFCQPNGPIVAAWGVNGGVQANTIRYMAKGQNVFLQCLGMTKDGHPRHPLYVRGDQPLIPYPEI